MSFKERIIEKLEKGEELDYSERGFAVQMLLDNIKYLKEELAKLKRKRGKASGAELEKINKKIKLVEADIADLERKLEKIGPLDVRERASPLGPGFSNKTWW
ncbi:MAG: hypothetical protein ACTSQY_11420 [Candidatus Odinarchaeia archaeon]